MSDEFEISQDLKAKGISKIVQEVNTIVVIYNEIPIRFDINKNSWQKTIDNFEKAVEKYSNLERDLLQQIIVCLSLNWNNIIKKESDEDPITSFEDSSLKVEEKNQVDLTTKLRSEIENQDYRENVINTIKKEVKQEDTLIRQIFDTAISAYSTDPANLGIIAPTSEGKTYTVEKTLQYFPKQDVWTIGSMSPKSLIRQKGTIVDKNTNQPIEQKIKEIRKQINRTRDKDEKSDLQEKLDKIIENSKILIDLNNTILVFLEPPHKDLWIILKPILSHDQEEIEYPFVEKTDKDGTYTKNVVVTGYPACIFCSAKDESGWSMWSEIQSRFWIRSPNMKPQKYHESNLIIGQRKGLPTLVQEHIIVSQHDKKLATESVIYLKNELLGIKNQADKNFNPVWIPFNRILANALEANKGSDVRVTKRIFSQLSIVTLTKSHLRPKLVFGNDTLVVCTLEDLAEVLCITQNLKGIPPHKMEFFKRIFIPTYLAKTEPDKHEKNDKQERIIAVTTRQLCDKLKEIDGKVMRTDALKETYLEEFLNNGLIDELPSEIDNRQKIYYPIVDLDEYIDPDEDVEDDDKQKIKKLSTFGNLDNNLQFSKIKPSKNYIKFDENWLKLEILDLMSYPTGITNFTLKNKNDEQLCICQFIKEYEQTIKLQEFFSSNNDNSLCKDLTNDDDTSIQDNEIENQNFSQYKYNNLDGYNDNSKYCNYSNKIFGNIKKIDYIDEKTCKKLSKLIEMDKNVILEDSKIEGKDTSNFSVDQQLTEKSKYNKQCPFCLKTISLEVDMEVRLAEKHGYEIKNRDDIPGGDFDNKINGMLERLKADDKIMLC